MPNLRSRQLLSILLLWCTPILGAFAEETRVVEGSVSRAVCRDHTAERRAFFGDLHVHTIFSLDASTMGTRNQPADAYRFARGEAVGVQPYTAGDEPMRTIELARPLDFAAVTDHSELLGEWNICNHPGLPGHDSMVCRIYRRWPRVAFFWMNFQASRAVRHDFCGEGGEHCLAAAREPWREIVEAAELAYDRSEACEFTSFVAYEWTGAAGTGNNFHRNVVFANDVVPDLPVSFIDTPDLVEFWQRLAGECIDAGTGCDVLVIPHNSNLSAGRMFRVVDDQGAPISVSEASARQRLEPLVEIMQHKGSSECMLGIDTEDELCAFENLETGNFLGRFFSPLAEPPVPRQFVRHILARGLAEEQRLGVNPFKFGIVASTDTHLGIPGAVAESGDYPGHGGAGKPPGAELPRGLPDFIDFNPGGLAVVWAEENSRSSLFAGMRRRETYGTSGPRIELRVFGGWDYPDDLCWRSDLVKQGYAAGVPMGGDLPLRPEGGSAPSFAVSALRDPGASGDGGTLLQRIQIVKGWVEAGELREAVIEIAGDSESDASVDLATCEAKGSGFDRLCAVWRDPAFDPELPAFYYARVLENPVCRWSQRACAAAGVQCEDPNGVPEGFEACCDPLHRPVVQERAWSSPIWYRPEGGSRPGGGSGPGGPEHRSGRDQ